MVNPQQLSNELDVAPLFNTNRPPVSLLDLLRDAIDLASDQDGVTWLIDRGKRIAAIVPVDAAEYVSQQGHTL